MPLDEYLRDQSIRLRRTKFGDSILSDELYTILSNITVETTGPITITTPDSPDDPVQQPSVDDLNIPPFDLDLPDNGINEPEVEAEPGFTRTTQLFWHRAVFPGQVLGQSEGAAYSVRIHVNGNLISDAEDLAFAPTTAQTKEVIASLTDASLAGTVANNSWVDVYWIAEYRITEEIFRDSQGKEINRQTEIKVVQEEYLFNGPASSSAGKVALVTSTITGRSGNTPGSGTATLYDFTPPEPDPINGGMTDPSITAGTSVTVFNMVTAEIEAGDDQFIQVKRIDNAWWVDVEDCGGSGSEQESG